MPKKASRHGWLQYNSVRLACMRRYGCLTEDDWLQAQFVLGVRLEWLLSNTGERREPHENEVADCINWAIETTEAKTDEQVAAELRSHHERETLTATQEAMFERWRSAPDRKPIAKPEFVIRKASELTPKRNEHLWQDEMVLNALNLISGPQGEGKSTIASWIAAEVSKGELEGALLGIPSDVVYLTFEEDPESTVLGRLKAMDADFERVLFVYEDDEGDELVNLVKSVSKLEQVLILKPNTRVVVIDPIIEGLAGTNTDSEAEVRKHLKHLRRLCKKNSVTVILVTHWNKNASAAIKQRIMGSTAFSSVPRTNYAVIPDYEDPEGKRRYLGCFKENASPEARTRKYPYRLVKQYVTVNGVEMEAPRIEWEPVENGGIEDYYNLSVQQSKTVTVKSPTTEQTERNKMHDEIARFIKREIDQSELVVDAGKHKGRKYVLSKPTQDLVINKGLVKNSTVEKYQREEINKACNLCGIEKSRLGMSGGWIYMLNNQYWTIRESI